MNASVTETLHEQLTQKQINLVVIGCTILGISIGALGLSLGTIQGPILRSVGGESYFSMVTTISSLAMCLMTPIGGRLIDMWGSRKVILYSNILITVSILIMAVSHNLWIFIITRFLMSLGLGAEASAPFILLREVSDVKNLPKLMGYLGAGTALGSFLGSYLAGLFTDMNMLWLAIIFPLVFVVIAVPLIDKNLPKIKPDTSIKMDYVGIILLAVAFGGIFMSLNFGPTIGWGDWKILAGFAIGIVGLILLWKTQNGPSALIPKAIFANKAYSMILLIAFFSVFYQTALNVYVPAGVQDLMHASNAASGSLQIPRTILSVVLPTFCGIWLAKNQTKNTWVSMAITGACILLSFSLLVFMGKNMPLWFVIVMVSFTGIADAFRGVTLTPAAQAELKPSDMGIGTSMLGFVITLSNLISSAIYGIAFDTLKNANPGAIGETAGLDTVFLLAAISGLICLILAVTVYRKMVIRNAAKKAAAAAEAK